MKSIRATIDSAVADATTPFPFDEIWASEAIAPGELDEIVPEIDLYVSTIAGYCASAAPIERWPKQRQEEAALKLAQPLTAHARKREIIYRLIRPETTPRAYAALQRIEAARLELLSRLRAHRV